MGFMLTRIGIETNPDKCWVAIDMRNPANMKAFNKYFLFFVALEKKEEFEWIAKCE